MITLSYQNYQNPSAVGRIPDVPELECDGDFREDLCDGCPEYEECKKEWEGELNDNTM